MGATYPEIAAATDIIASYIELIVVEYMQSAEFAETIVPGYIWNRNKIIRQYRSN
jgi:hypothetical protein